MLVLGSSSAQLLLVTGGSCTLAVHATWLDSLPDGSTTASDADSSVTTGTTTVLLGGAASGSRNIKFLSVRNLTGGPSVTVTIRHNDGTTTASLFSITLLAGYTVHYNTDTFGFVLYDSTGRQQIASAASGSTITTVSAGGTASLSQAASQVVLMDPTGSGAGQQSTCNLPTSPSDNDEVGFGITNWNFGTGAGPTAIPGPAVGAGARIVAASGHQVADPQNSGVYSAVAGTVTVNTYAQFRLKFHNANKTWFLTG